jgi:hypothetical protein
MKPNMKHGRVTIALTALFIATAAIAAAALSFSVAVNVSQTATPTEKAKIARLNFQDGATFKKAWLYTYGDGNVGSENIYAKYSFDEGVTWSDPPILLSKDAANNPTGGQSILTKGSYTLTADNNKPNIFSPPATDHPNVVVTWTSSYCPEDPAAANSGSYNSNVQGQSSLVDGGAIDHPFFCVWAATTTDPTLSNWTVTQLTNGERDAIGDVARGNSKGQGFALAWQEDPTGLRPGEAEGPGDGGSGATVSPGTNIWYTYAPTPDGAIFRTNIRQASDNSSTAMGTPGASRPNLSMSGNNAVLVYEETACPGGSSGKCIVYHSFLYDTKTWTATDAAGTIVSDPANNARRVRVVLQGATAAPTSDLRTLLLWRESAAAAGEGAPADIVIRRGLVRAGVAGSSGYKADDILADTPQKMTDLAAGCGNANAHRALIRDNFIALAYDITSSMDGANPKKSNPTTANYNLVLTRSIDSGATWETATNLSNRTDVSVRVVEPRIVPTPGTIKNPVSIPISGVPDTGDTQDTNTFFIAYATAGNDATAAAGKVYVSRTTDQGVTFEAFVPVSNAPGGQSESQFRATPDGSMVAALWMQEQANGNKDAMFAMATPVAEEPLAATTPAVISGGVCPAPIVQTPPFNLGGGGGCSAAIGQQPLDPVLPVLAVLALIGLVVRRWRSGPELVPEAISLLPPKNS